MKLIIEISENIYDTIMSDVMPDAGQMSVIITRIYQGKPYEERPTGHWLSRYYYRKSTNSYDVHMFVCSECGYEYSYDGETGRSDNNFCPNCGADMWKEAEND